MSSPLLNFEELYQGRGFESGGARVDVIPWRLDRPQPIIVELADAGEITGPVLECGCGFGDNALFLAARGHDVTAFDAAPTAIEHDIAKAAAAGVPVRFLVADATTLEGIPGGFRTAIDSAMLHCLDEDQRRAYLAGLLRVCEPGARLHILCFRAEVSNAFPLPAPQDEESIRAAFPGGWTIERFQPRQYTTALTPGAQLPTGMAGNVDEDGHVLLPIWQITAVRK
jgi:SAM-dependent methyltransferase